MNQLILHIPHSNPTIPFFDGYITDKSIIEAEMLKLTDWYTEDLFNTSQDLKIVAPFSRIFCDVERFSNDSQEVMAKYGMGVLYERSDDGMVMRKVPEELRAIILKNYYYKHHAELDTAVGDQLNRVNKALIIDCHSFPDIPMIRDLNQDKNRPDINIGTDAFHTSDYITVETKHFFECNGYSVGINWP